MAEGRTVARVYRRFGEVQASPLYARVGLAFSESGDALLAIQTMPASRRQPAVVLAALHDLALAGRAPALAAAYDARDGDAAAAAAIDTLVRLTDAVVSTAARRPVRADETGRHGVLYPAVAEAAHRVGAEAVALIDVGRSAGLNLDVDRVGVTYSNGQTLGDASSAVQQSCSLVGGRPVPTWAIPEVVARIGIDRHPLDVTDADDARWLRACIAPDQPDRTEQLEAEIALAAPARRFRADALEVLPEVIAGVPEGALPVVVTTWTLARVPVASRPRLLNRLEEAAAGRAVAWVSAEGVGVAPGVPTLGDRPASGHSIIGLTLFDGSHRPAEALGRCWSRGRLLAWLAPSSAG